MGSGLAGQAVALAKTDAAIIQPAFIPKKRIPIPGLYVFGIEHALFQMLRFSPAKNPGSHLRIAFLRFVNPRTQLATLTLLAILQKSPALLRLFNGLKFSVEPATRILQKLSLVATSLSSAHALSGASPANYSTSTGNGNSSANIQALDVDFDSGDESTVSVALTRVSAGRRTPDSWSVTGAPPPGMIIEGINLSGTNRVPINQQGIFNEAVALISGTPTQAGTYDLLLKPWEDSNAQGRTADPFELTIKIVATELIPPVSSIQNNQNEFVVTWSANPNQNYELQSSSNPLDPQSWTPLQTTIETNGDQQSATFDKSTLPQPFTIRVASTSK